MASNTGEDSQVQKMLSIIYQIPMGLIEADAGGNILQMNAKSVQLLMPLFFSEQLAGDNIHQLLENKLPGLLEAVRNFTEPRGTIVNQIHQEIQFSNHAAELTTWHFIFTINKLDAGTFMYIFDDMTDLYNKEKQLNQIIQDKAIEQSKFEIASGVLHDIGNAVVGFGSYITKIKRSVEQSDQGTIQNLRGFVEKNLPALQTAIGAKKADALLDLLSGLIAHQKNNLDEIKNSISDQMKIISHIQEILNIQRQYVRGNSSEREPVNIRSVVNDAVSMLFGAMDKNDITFNFDAPAALPKLKGDRTKLMQVFINILKNAVESLSAGRREDKEINVFVKASKTSITIMIKDNGKGFDAETGAALFSRGYSTKTEGSGLGLVNCRSIIEGHNGQITLTSDGIDMGATATIIFNI